MVQMDKTPLMILTGFLGAGKTTLLNHILNGDHGRRIAVLVNDFGVINIDAQLVVDVDSAEDIVSLSNGCICCTIRGDLNGAVMGLLATDTPPDAIIIETSGVSDPIDVLLTLRQLEQVRIESVLTVIDAEQVMDVDAQYHALIWNQIGTADLIVLNKVDLVDDEQLASVRRYVRKIASDARLIEVAHGAVPLEILLGGLAYDMSRLAKLRPTAIHIHEGQSDHIHADDSSLLLQTWHWQHDDALNYRALQRIIERLPQGVYRAKGIFYLADAPDVCSLVQVVGKRVTVAQGAAWQGAPQSQFVVIAAAGTLDEEQLSALFEGALAKNTPSNQLERLAKTALSWLRRA